MLDEVDKVCEGTSGTGAGKPETGAAALAFRGLSFPTWDYTS